MELTAYIKKIDAETWNRRNSNKRVVRDMVRDKRLLDKAINGEYDTLDSRVALSEFPLEDLLVGKPALWSELLVKLKDAEITHSEWEEALLQADEQHYRSIHRLWKDKDRTLVEFLEQPTDQTLRTLWERYIRNEGNQRSDYVLEDNRLTRSGTAEGDLQVVRSLAMNMREMTEAKCMNQMHAYQRVMQQDYEETMLFRLFRRTIDMRSTEWDATPMEYMRFYLERRTDENIPAFIKFMRYYRNRYWLWRYTVGDDEPEAADLLDDIFPLAGGEQRMPSPIDSTQRLSANRDLANLQEQNEKLRNQVRGLKAEMTTAISLHQLVDYAIEKEDKELANTLKLCILEIKKDLTIEGREELERIDKAFRMEKKRIMEEAARNGLTVEVSDAPTDISVALAKGPAMPKCRQLCVTLEADKLSILDKAEAAGIIVYNAIRKGYDAGKTTSNALIAYLCGRMFCGDHTDKDGYWAAGGKMSEASMLADLFGFDVAATRRSARGSANGKSPVGCERVDSLFK